MAYLWVAIGGALGSMARYGIVGLVGARAGGGFPYGTIVVNVTGSMLIGFVGTLSGPDSRFFVPVYGRLFLMTGICGGYTTFSAFSLETANLMRGGNWGAALANVGFSVILCLVAIWVGHVGALALDRLRGG
jgi:fluoride exporter